MEQLAHIDCILDRQGFIQPELFCDAGDIIRPGFWANI